MLATAQRWMEASQNGAEQSSAAMTVVTQSGSPVASSQGPIPVSANAPAKKPLGNNLATPNNLALPNFVAPMVPATGNSNLQAIIMPQAVGSVQPQTVVASLNVPTDSTLPVALESFATQSNSSEQALPSRSGSLANSSQTVVADASQTVIPQTSSPVLSVPISNPMAQSLAPAQPTIAVKANFESQKLAIPAAPAARHAPDIDDPGLNSSPATSAIGTKQSAEAADPIVNAADPTVYAPKPFLAQSLPAASAASNAGISRNASGQLAAEVAALPRVNTESISSTSGATTNLMNPPRSSIAQAQNVAERASAGSISAGQQNSGVGTVPVLGSIFRSEAGTTGEVSPHEITAASTLAIELDPVDTPCSANVPAANSTSPNSSLPTAAPSAADTESAPILSDLNPVLIAVAQKGFDAFAAQGNLAVAINPQALAQNSPSVQTKAPTAPGLDPTPATIISPPVQPNLPEPAPVTSFPAVLSEKNIAAYGASPFGLANLLTFPKAQDRLVSANTAHDPGGATMHAPSAEAGKTRVGQVLVTASGPSTGLALSNKTPFDVFFSNPESDTESAAAVLPRMVLPSAGPPVRDSHASALVVPTANSQPAGAQGTPRTQASASNADSPTAANATSSPAAQSPLRDADVPAQLQGVVTENAGPQVAAEPMASATANFPLAAFGPSNTEPAAKGAESPDQPPSIPTTQVPPSPEVQTTAGPVQLAQLSSRPELAEMRIGLSTTAFGGVEVRTVVHANDVGVLIGSEKGDLRGLLQNDLPVIANTLQEQNLRLHSVNFMQGFAFSNNGGSPGRDQSQQRSFYSQRSAENLNAPDQSSDGDVQPPAMAYSTVPGALSILA